MDEREREKSMRIQDYTANDFLGQDTRGVIAGKIQTILDNMRDKGVLYMEGKDCITGYAYHEIYDWDLYFEQRSVACAGGLLRNNLSCNEQTSIRVWMLVCLCSPQTQCTGTVRIIAPSCDLWLLDKLEFVKSRNFSLRFLLLLK